MNWKDIFKKYDGTDHGPDREEKRYLKSKATIKEMYQGKQLNKTEAIRAFCIDCCGGSRNEVYLCPSRDCALYPYRLKTNPWLKEASLKQKEAARNNMAKLRASQDTK